MEFLLAPVLAALVAASLHIVGHEIAHILAGWFVGFRVVGLEFGPGKSKLRLRLGSVPITLTPLPLFGYVRFNFEQLPSTPYRMCIMLAAGPLFHAVIVAIPFVVLGPTALLTSTAESLTIWRMIVIWNFALFLINGIPHYYFVDNERRESDGQQILNLFRAQRTMRLASDSDGD